MDAIQKVTAQDIMVQPVKCAKPTEMLEDLEQRLMDSHLSGMPVVENGAVVGFISKTDLVRLDVVRKVLDGYVEDRNPWIGSDGGSGSQAASQASAGSKPLKQLTVHDAMRSDVVICSPDAPVVEVAQQMVKHQIHRIVVVRDEEIVGIISTLDLAKLIAAKA